MHGRKEKGKAQVSCGALGKAKCRSYTTVHSRPGTRTSTLVVLAFNCCSTATDASQDARLTKPPPAGYNAGTWPSSPMAEAADLSPAKCEFESHLGYHEISNRCRRRHRIPVPRWRFIPMVEVPVWRLGMVALIDLQSVRQYYL